ncbi:hypothetical protein GS485_11285 [Rhodococcus hoagii]|nr:hypothetical protein [Prescottella equi]
MQFGDRVRIRPGGASIFTIVEDPDEDGKMLIQPVDSAWRLPVPDEAGKPRG